MTSHSNNPRRVITARIPGTRPARPTRPAPVGPTGATYAATSATGPLFRPVGLVPFVPGDCGHPVAAYLSDGTQERCDAPAGACPDHDGRTPGPVEPAPVAPVVALRRAESPTAHVPGPRLSPALPYARRWIGRTDPTITADRAATLDSGAVWQAVADRYPGGIAGLVADDDAACSWCDTPAVHNLFTPDAACHGHYVAHFTGPDAPAGCTPGHRVCGGRIGGTR